MKVRNHKQSVLRLRRGIEQTDKETIEEGTMSQDEEDILQHEEKG